MKPWPRRLPGEGALRSVFLLTHTRTLGLTAALLAVTRGSGKFHQTLGVRATRSAIILSMRLARAVVIPFALSCVSTGEDAVTKGHSLGCAIIREPSLRVSWSPGSDGSGAEYLCASRLFHLTCLQMTRQPLSQKGGAVTASIKCLGVNCSY